MIMTKEALIAQSKVPLWYSLKMQRCGGEFRFIVDIEDYPKDGYISCAELQEFLGV